MYSKQTWTNGDVITQEKLNHMEDGIANSGLRLVEVQLTITNFGSNCELTNARELANLLKSDYRDVYNTVLYFTVDNSGMTYSASLPAGLGANSVMYTDSKGVIEIFSDGGDDKYVISDDGTEYRFSDSDIDENDVAHFSQSSDPDIR